MRLRLSAISILLFILSLTLSTGCNRNYPSSILIPSDQSIWKNGAPVSWLGNDVWTFSEQCVISIIYNPPAFIPCIASQINNVVDNINGDTRCLTFYHPATGNCTSGTMLELGLNSWTSPQYGIYYYPVTLGGPILTPVTLAWSPSPVTFAYPVTVTPPAMNEDASAYYALGRIQFDIRLEAPASTFSSIVLNYGNSAGIPATYSIDPTTLSTTKFTHLSIPLQAFSSNQTASVDEPFDIAFVIPGALPVSFISVNDVKWTGN